MLTVTNRGRSHECPFLTVGETLLILRDLVRRKVLVEDVVPDTEQVRNVWIYIESGILFQLILVFRILSFCVCRIPSPDDHCGKSRWPRLQFWRPFHSTRL